MATSSNLFKPLQVGRCSLGNRLALAPLTRNRADDHHVPVYPMVAEYYAQRASVPGTLLITEATFIAPQAGLYDRVPGIWSDAQIAGWKRVTDAVHAKKSFIFMQLWALGRASSPETLQKELGEGAKLVGAGDIPIEGHAKPTPLTEGEIWEYVQWYAQAARNAIAAGFDGVEVHGANGYLPDQFLQDVSNNRTDAWGGTVENRARFTLEVVKAIVEAVGPDRTSIRLSPFSTFQSMRMADPVPQFSHLVKELKQWDLAYIHLVESRIAGNLDTDHTEKLDPFIDIWGNHGPILLAGGFTPSSARKAVDEDYPDKQVVVVFGRYFISNPDLVSNLYTALFFFPTSKHNFKSLTNIAGF